MTEEIKKFAEPINAHDYCSPNSEITLKNLTGIEIFQLASIVESCNDAIISTDFNGTILTWNKAAENIFGFAAREVIGQKISILLLPELRSEETEIDERIKRGERIDHYETIRIKKDGSFVPVSLTVSPIKNEAGEIIGVSKIARDISERKHTEDLLRLSEERYRLLFENNPYPMWVYDIGTLNFLAVNEAAIAHYGHSRKEFLSMTIKDIRSAEDIPALLQDITENAGRLSKAGIWKHRRKDGSIIYAEIHSHQMSYDGTGSRLVLANDVTERLNYETQLNKILKDLADIKFALDESSIVAITDQSGKITYVNDNFCKISGYSRAELISQDHRIINRDHQSKDFIRNIWTIVNSGRVWHGEIRNRAKNGSYYWVDTTIVPFLDENGTPYQYVGILNDITERKTAESELRQKVLLIEQSYEPIFVWDLERGIIEWNAGCERLYGFTRREAIGQISHELLQTVFPVSLPDFLSLLKQNESWSGEMSHRTKSGREVTIESRHQLLELDGRRVVLETNRDITERKLAEEALKNNEHRFRALIEHSSDGISLIDENNEILYLSPSVKSVEGYSPEELIGHNGVENTHPDDLPLIKETVEKLLANPGTPIPVEWRRRHKDGHWMWLEGFATNLLDDPAVRAIVTNYRDITERKSAGETILQLNENLEQKVAERTLELKTVNKELEAFSYSVSHDLRAPLRAMDGFSLALLEDYEDKIDAVGQNYLHRIRAASQQMAQLIDDMLQLSRVTRSEINKKEINLSEMVKAIAAWLRENQPRAGGVIFDIQENIYAYGDERLLKIALENLVGNAYKFTSKLDTAEIIFGQKQAGNELVYFVRDNGAGFDMTYSDKLFGAFQRFHSAREFEGTGIGLATVQRVISRHGGHIYAESKVGQGAAFYFTIK